MVVPATRPLHYDAAQAWRPAAPVPAFRAERHHGCYQYGWLCLFPLGRRISSVLSGTSCLHRLSPLAPRTHLELPISADSGRPVASGQRNDAQGLLRAGNALSRTVRASLGDVSELDLAPVADRAVVHRTSAGCRKV